MESTLQTFEKRQKALRRKHQRMARGYVNKMDPKSGVILQRPDQKAGGIGLRVLILTVVGFLVFKVFLLSGLGQEAYLTHVSELQTGSVFEQIGATLMGIDPVTQAISEKIGSFL